MKKVFLIFIAFFVLGIVFFLSEERHEEGLSEVKFWIINPEEIHYYPPVDSSEFTNFLQTKLTFKKIELGLKKNPIFILKGNDKELKEDYLYEANYNVKNLFTELSVISTKSIISSTPELLRKFQIFTENSPSVEILKSSKLENNN